MEALERFVGVSGKSLLFVSSQACEIPGGKTIPVPHHLAGLSDSELVRSYEYSRGQFRRKDAVLEASSMKVALISVYGIECGISTYTEFLANELRSRVGELRVFAEDWSGEGSDPNVVRCWKRGEPLGRLANEIREWDPDVVLIQHEYGLFPKANHWLALLSLLHKYRVYVTLHSVYNHADKTICEAAVPNIIVHTSAGRNVLRSKGINRPIHEIRHGCLQPEQSQGRLWNLYQTPHTLIQFGFGFRYKGWEESIRITAELKKEFPDVFFTGIFSESKFSKPAHDQYFSELEEMVHNLDLIENVGFVRGFLSEPVLDSYLRTNSVAIFPYIDNGEHTVYGCSGAARVAMKAQLPVVVSNAPLFDDLSGVCPRVGSVQGFAAEVRNLWKLKANREDQVTIQNQFLERNSWAKVASHYVQVLSGRLLETGEAKAHA